jgi:hypothetical protein
MRCNPQRINIEIDRLTNSIEKVITGDNFRLMFLQVDKADLKPITKKNGWSIN